MPPSSGEKPLQDEEAASSAIICKPIKAQAFSVSAATRGLNSAAFVRTGSSFLMRKTKLATRPVLPGTFRTLAVVRKPTTSQGSRKGQTPRGPSHIFCKIYAPFTLAAIHDERDTSKRSIRHENTICEPKFQQS